MLPLAAQAHRAVRMTIARLPPWQGEGVIRRAIGRAATKTRPPVCRIFAGGIAVRSDSAHVSLGAVRQFGRAG